MRLFIIVGLFALLGYLLYRGFRNPAGRQWHGGTRFPWWGILAVVVVLVPSVFFEARWLYTQYQASTVTKLVSDRADTKTVCQRAGATFINPPTNNAGFVKWEENDERGSGSTALLKYETCRDFRDWLFSGKTNPSDKQISAVHIVVHEAFHVAGETNEARTECSSILALPAIAQKLGASATQAEAMSERYTTAIYPHLSAEYLTDCASETDLLPILGNNEGAK